MAMATTLLSSSSNPPNPPPQKPSSKPISPIFKPNSLSRRSLFLSSVSSLAFLPLTFNPLSSVPISSAETSTPSKPFLAGIANTKSWFQFFGDGFAIRVPPEFQDFTEPEDYSAGLSLYGDKAKPKTYAARFASPDGAEVVSVVIRSSNSLKITFLEAKDITDMGSLKEAAKLFVPGDGKAMASPISRYYDVLNGGATLYSARTIKVKEDEGFRTYYFYEFGRDEEHFALVTAVNRGKVFIAGAAAPQYKWDDDGVKLRSAAVSLTVL